jgi:hypothetical protein
MTARDVRTNQRRKAAHDPPCILPIKVYVVVLRSANPMRRCVAITHAEPSPSAVKHRHCASIWAVCCDLAW